MHRLIQRNINYLHRRCGIIFRQIILIPWHVSSCLKKQCYWENDYLKNVPIVSLFKCTAKKIICYKKDNVVFFLNWKKMLNETRGKFYRQESVLMNQTHSPLGDQFSC